MSDLPPGAWHPDPSRRFDLRYWDGSRWAEWVCAHGGEPHVDAPPPPSEPQDSADPIALVPAEAASTTTYEPELLPAVQDGTDAAPREWSRRELNDLEKRSKTAIKQLDKQHTELGDLALQAPRELRKAFQRHVDERRWEIFTEQPVERLKEFAHRVPVAAIQRVGLSLASLHDSGSDRYQSINGVGATGAVQLRRALDQLREWADEQPVTMPRPDQLDDWHHELLRAAARANSALETSRLVCCANSKQPSKR